MIVGRKLHEAVFRAILAEEHASQLVTAPSPGRRWPRRGTDRQDRYARVLSSQTHDMHWDYASSFVTVAPGARGQD